MGNPTCIVAAGKRLELIYFMETDDSRGSDHGNRENVLNPYVSAPLDHEINWNYDPLVCYIVSARPNLRKFLEILEIRRWALAKRRTLAKPTRILIYFGTEILTNIRKSRCFVILARKLAFRSLIPQNILREYL